MKLVNLAVFAATTALAAPPQVTKQEAPKAEAGSKAEAASKRVLYFLDSNPNNASIVSIPIGDDGSLQGINASSPVRTPTNGLGGINVDVNGTAAGADPLLSQDSVVVNGNRLFTVNAGSNTLAYFHIPTTDPLHPQPMSSVPVSTEGEFPNSVAYSEKNQLACVSNTGKKAGVQCFHVPDCAPLEKRGRFMDLTAVINQTSPPLGSGTSVSDLVFNPAGTALFVTIKGASRSQGFVYAYPVKDGELQDPVISSPEGLRRAFSLSFVSDESAVVTDPTNGAALLTIDSNFSVSVAKNITIPGQRATCWSVYSPKYESVYVFDGMTPNVTSLESATGAIKPAIPGDARGMGSLDAAIDRSWLYVLQGSPAIAVFDLEASKGKEAVSGAVRYFDLAFLGNRSSWIGMAVYSPAKK